MNTLGLTICLVLMIIAVVCLGLGTFIPDKKSPESSSSKPPTAKPDEPARTPKPVPKNGSEWGKSIGGLVVFAVALLLLGLFVLWVWRGIAGINRWMDEPRRASAAEVKTTVVKMEPFKAQEVKFDPRFNYFQCDVPNGKSVLVQCLDENGQPIPFRCNNGQWLTEVLDRSGSKLVITEYERNPKTIRLLPAFASDGAYSIEVKEYKK